MNANPPENDDKLYLEALINSIRFAMKAAEEERTPIVLLTMNEAKEAAVHLEELSRLLYNI